MAKSNMLGYIFEGLFVCFSPFLLFDILIKSLQVWARVVCFCAFLMVPSQPVLLPPLGLYPSELWSFYILKFCSKLSSCNNECQDEYHG